MSLYSGMYDNLCTFNDSRLGIIAIVIICCVVLIYSKCMYRRRMNDMQKLLSDIRSEQKQLMHEHCELERKYHMYM